MFPTSSTAQVCEQWFTVSGFSCLIRCICGTVHIAGVAISKSLKIPHEGIDRSSQFTEPCYWQLPRAIQPYGMESTAHNSDRIVRFEKATSPLPWLPHPCQLRETSALCELVYFYSPLLENSLARLFLNWDFEPSHGRLFDYWRLNSSAFPPPPFSVLDDAHHESSSGMNAGSTKAQSTSPFLAAVAKMGG